MSSHFIGGVDGVLPIWVSPVLVSIFLPPPDDALQLTIEDRESAACNIDDQIQKKKLVCIIDRVRWCDSSIYFGYTFL